MDWTLFAIFLAACGAAAATGSLFRPGAWYESLDKPRWTPPNWLFPVAWALLYVAIALAAARAGAKGAPPHALALWALQIVLNTLWTPVFFGLGRIRGAVVVIGALWLVVLATTVTFLQADTWAGLLFLPYLVWVSYAAALNVSIARRNPGVTGRGTPVPARERRSG